MDPLPAFVVTLYSNEERSEVTIDVPDALESSFKCTVRGWEATPYADKPKYPYLLSTRDQDAIGGVCELLDVQDAVRFDSVHALTMEVPIMYPRDGPVLYTTEVAYSSIRSTKRDDERYQQWILDIDKELRVADQWKAIALRERRAEVIKWWVESLD